MGLKAKPSPSSKAAKKPAAKKTAKRATPARRPSASTRAAKKVAAKKVATKAAPKAAKKPAVKPARPAADRRPAAAAAAPAPTSIVDTGWVDDTGTMADDNLVAIPDAYDSELDDVPVADEAELGEPLDVGGDPTFDED